MTSPTGGPRQAGYSGTPLPRKLGIKPGHTVAVLGGPVGFADGLAALSVPMWRRRCPPPGCWM